MRTFIAVTCLVLCFVPVASAQFVFGTPMNLGPTVNSSVAEEAPSVSADGLSLFFCSVRPGGSGQGDLRVVSVEQVPTAVEHWGLYE